MAETRTRTLAAALPLQGRAKNPTATRRRSVPPAEADAAVLVVAVANLRPGDQTGGNRKRSARDRDRFEAGERRRNQNPLRRAVRPKAQSGLRASAGGDRRAIEATTGSEAPALAADTAAEVEIQAGVSLPKTMRMSRPHGIAVEVDPQARGAVAVQCAPHAGAEAAIALVAPAAGVATARAPGVPLAGAAAGESRATTKSAGAVAAAGAQSLATPRQTSFWCTAALAWESPASFFCSWRSATIARARPRRGGAVRSLRAVPNRHQQLNPFGVKAKPVQPSAGPSNYLLRARA